VAEVINMTDLTNRCEKAVERMARAAVKDSMPTNGMFNSYQLDAMADERMDTYRRIARVMLNALLTE
jgi:hypothetical protein